MSRLRLKTLSLCLLLVMLLTGCGRHRTTMQPQTPAVPSPAPKESSPIPTANHVPAPISGRRVEPGTIATRPIAVMIDNAPTARPHYGLSQADLLYEMLVEGGLTRIMAVFHSRQSEVIGPVRSVRPAFVEKVLELDAILVHCGGSEEALQSIPALGIRDIDEISWSSPFWRDPKRYAPHNLFTSSLNLTHAAAGRKDFAGTIDQPVFAFSDEMSAGSPAVEVNIRYPGGYIVGYRYDTENKLYRRFMNGEPHIDVSNKQALTAVNLVIEVISVKVLDSEGRLRFESVGKGEAYIITQGTLRKGQWVKDTPQALTRLVDSQGKEITMTPGVTWVQQATPTTPVEIR